jgi:D-alanyl-D-alanine carboxypeptidase
MPLSRRRFLGTAAWLAAGAAVSPQALAGIRPAASGAIDAGRLDAVLEAAVAARHTPGVALAVWHRGEPLYRRAIGSANLETASGLGIDSVFRVGSVSKQVTAALVLRLVGQGRLALDDPAQKYLPVLSKHAPFSVLELLNHTAGIRDGEYDTRADHTLSHLEQAERMAAQAPFFDFPPGTAWLYSNAGYLLVGAIIEKVTGLSLAQAAATELFEPLGLRHTAFDRSGEVVPGRVSGYTPTGEAAVPFENAAWLDVGLAGAAGALRSTAEDLCRWQQSLWWSDALPRDFARPLAVAARLRDGRLAREARFAERDRAMGETDYGLGLMLDRGTRDGSLILGHHGGINGFAAYAASHPASGLSYACLCNADTHPGLPLRDVRRTVFAAVLPPPVD